MLEERLRCSTFDVEIRLFIACIPYYEMELSAKFTVVNLYRLKSYFFVYSIEMSFIIVLTPSLMEYRLRI